MKHVCTRNSKFFECDLYFQKNKIFYNRFAAVLLPILKEAGPSIFFKSQSLIVPSGSLEILPSSKTLSVGKVITWSGPATAIGGLLFSLHFSHEGSFLQEKNVPILTKDNSNHLINIFFITTIELGRIESSLIFFFTEKY